MLFDTNVILDLLLDRKPHVEAATLLFASAERGELNGYICATTVTAIFYLATKVVGAKTTRQQLKMLLNLFEIAPVTRAVLEDALNNQFRDFEDSVLYEATRHAGVEAIITHNLADFNPSKLPIYSPIEFAVILATQKN